MTRLFLLRLAGATLLAALAAILITQRPAAAASLRAAVTVHEDVVRLGDLFDDAGGLAATPVFQAPDAGVDGLLPAADALAAAARAGLAVTPSAVQAVRVTRGGIRLDEPDFTVLLRGALARRLGTAEESLDIAFDGLVEGVVADASAAYPATVAALALQAGSGRFEARLAVDIGAGERLIDLSGRVSQMREIPVLARPVDRRQVIRAGDLTTRRIDARQLSRVAAVDAGMLIGMAARRPLRAGETVAVADVEPPRLVLRGQPVTMVFQRPGLTLTVRGRALADGALGETVSVLNEKSRRSVDGIVTADGTVAIGAAAPVGPALTQ